MHVLEKLFAAPQFSLPRAEKEALLGQELAALQSWHTERCAPYRAMMQAAPALEGAAGLHSLPFLPVRLFKGLDLRSIPQEELFKVLTSSGTTSQQVSRIAIDRETSLLQAKALAAIVTSFIGPKRLPMIILDSRSVLANRSSLSARGAGLLGLSNFGRDHFYALDESMRLDLAGVRAYLEKHPEGPVLLFGFTFMVWQYLVAELHRAGTRLPLERGILIHGGGWKKLQEEAVSNAHFKEALREWCGMTRVHNFYGMVEQVGSIYMECECGYLHAPNFAEIVTRDHRDWSPLPPGESGIIETLSVLPRSYPGHALLTEDLGTVHGIDDCPCGRLGTRFSVHGRVPHAELRGCSDTHAYRIEGTEGAADLAVLLPAPRRAAPETLEEEGFFRRDPLPPFHGDSVRFLAALSQKIFALREAKENGALAALAYWLRPANITGYLEKFVKTVGEGELVLPRGVAFHVAPGNVDTIFLYSWALSLLSGNLNVVRLPRTTSPQLQALLHVLRALFEDPAWGEIACRNLVVSYGREDDINRFFARRADVRMLWGGDETALHFRGLPAKPTTQDIVFADKVSYTVVNAQRYNEESAEGAAHLARLFHADAYQFDQMACSSPRTVYFQGSDAACVEASRRFWSLLSEESQRRGSGAAAATAVSKLVFGYESAAHCAGGAFPYGLPAAPPAVLRVSPASAAGTRNHCGGGFFRESFVGELTDLASLVEKSDQTLSYALYDRKEMLAAGPLLCARGIQRIVPVGQALTFAPVWDGYVLFGELTRRVVVG